jgi:hypothetical protein
LVIISRFFDEPLFECFSTQTIADMTSEKVVEIACESRAVTSAREQLSDEIVSLETLSSE